MIGFALGSPLLLLLGNLSIYDEAIIWGFAWSLAALYFACRSRTTEGAALTRSLLAFSFCAGAALLSRATFGAPFVLIAPLLAIRLFHRQPIRNITALLLPLGTAFVFYLFLSYARFGDFSGMNMRYNANPVQRDFAVKHGLFRLERVPYSFADYFVLRSPKLQREAPFLKANRTDYQHETLYVMPFTETYSSLLWSSSWILLGAVIGVAMLLRPGGADGVDRAIAAIFLLQVIVILSFMGLCPTLPCGAFSISNLRFSDLSAAGQNCISVALFVYRTGCCLGCDQLIDDRLVACGSRHECAGGNPGEMESVSGQNVTKLTGERERWTSRSGFSMLAFPK